jgi:hypothetical protein
VGPFLTSAQEGRTLAEPFHKIQEDNIQASIWKNEGGSEGHYFTVSLTKSYQRDGETHYSTSFGHFDLIRVARLSLMATEWITKQGRKKDRKKNSTRPGRRERAAS